MRQIAEIHLWPQTKWPSGVHGEQKNGGTNKKGTYKQLPNGGFWADADREASWLTYVKQGVTYLTEMSPRKLWKWIKNTSGVGSKSSKNTHPLKDAKGDMKTSDSDIADIWIEHYRKLAQESREIFRSAEYWETSQQLTKLSELEVNGPLSWSEIRGVITGIRKNKSAGEDGLPAE
ncbi:hypothetical protein SeMB42_g02477 [Synchytrium endobioticum]|uniref:Uncharacterized protein n=1 Tax=Synchytrium endobioticum TaxID=286115 RepID=A0A507DDL9_9FUNG|nr:hypothetical protein SeLEV6574_g07911 [Synchytrium endobioticum]TPX49782.1 hypothetical protein SeMB42_g02477 [Synchytrium endobioticum]